MNYIEMVAVSALIIVLLGCIVVLVTDILSNEDTLSKWSDDIF